MRMPIELLVAFTLTSITGCNLVPQKYQLAAEPLMEVPAPSTTLAQAAPSNSGLPATYVTAQLQPIDQVNILVQDSQTKCAAFVNSMFAQTAGSGLALDVLSTATSAISSIVNPLSTAHALGAVSTLLGATKTGITADYLNTLSVSHVTQAIQSSYTADMKRYIDSLSSLTEVQKHSLSPFQERSKILSYHSECSLAAAEGSISSTLQAATSVNQELSFSFTVVDEKTQADVAKALSEKINSDPEFSKAGINATVSGNIVQISMANAETLTITSTPSSLIHYTAGPPGQLAIIGTPQKGNTITISHHAAQQSSGAAAPTMRTALTGTAPAAVAGLDLKLK